MSAVATKSIPYLSNGNSGHNLRDLFAISLALLASQHPNMNSTAMNEALSGTLRSLTTPSRPVFVAEGGSFVPVITINEMRQLSQKYVFYDYQSVEGFLRAHPHMVAVLLEALPQVEKFFGKGIGVTLRVMCDQESDPSLSARIQTFLEVNEARAARKAFNVSWWMRQTDTQELPLTFSVELM